MLQQSWFRHAAARDAMQPREIGRPFELQNWWRVVGSWWFGGSWFVVRGSWFVVRGSWFVVRGSWFVGIRARSSPGIS